jgi:transcription-repair coupling factor (superfamily II helicase)
MFQQDIATWMQVGAAGSSPSLKPESPTAAEPPPTHNPIAPNSSLFFPAWEVLPHDERLPHVDVIGDRLETLVALTRDAGRSRFSFTARCYQCHRAFAADVSSKHF